MGRGSPTAAPSPAERQRDSQHRARVEGAARKMLELFFYIYIFFSSPAIFSPPAHSTAPHRTRDLAPCRDMAPSCPPCLQHQVMQRETAHHQLVPMEYRRTGQGSSKRIGLWTGMATGGQC